MDIIAADKFKKKPRRRTAPAAHNVDAEIRNLDKLDSDSLKRVALAVCLMAYYAYGYNLEYSTKDKIGKFVRQAFPDFELLGMPVNIVNNALNDIEENGTLEQHREDYGIVVSSLAVLKKRMLRQSHFTEALINIIEDARKASNGSDISFKQMHKNMGVFKNAEVSAMITGMTQQVDTQTPYMEEYLKLIKKLGGQGLSLDLQEAPKAKAKNPKIYSEYRTLRLKLKKLAEEFVRNLVRNQGDKDGLYDYKEMMKKLTEGGFLVHRYPTGFEGYIDDASNIYTKQKLRLTGLPQGGVVEMNPKYKAETNEGYVFRSRAEGAVSWTRYYTQTQVKTRSDTKFEKTAVLLKHLPKIRKKWRRIIKQGKPIKSQNDPEFLSACILEIIYQSQARIGSPSNKSKVDGVYQTTYGITTTRMGQVRERGDGLSFNYRGKKNQKQKNLFNKNDSKSAAKVVATIKKWKERREGTEPVFQTKRGNPLSAYYVNRLLKKLGLPSGITAHKFRHAKGCQMMKDIVAQHPFKEKPAKSATNITAWLKTEAVKIGQQLGHRSGDKYTGDTAIKNYVEPEVMIDIYRQSNLVPPKFLLSLTGIGTDSLDGYQ